jgi:hypothetical protein
VTDTQLYLSIGLPTLAVVLGMILNGFLFNALSARMNSLESRMLSLDEHMNLMIGKIGEIDTRLSVLEDRSNRS